MQKSKESLKDIAIAAGAGGIWRSPDSTGGQFAKQKTKSIHPPIESHWHLPPPKEHKRPKNSFMAILTYPLMLRNSLTQQKSQSMKMILEGAHDPKDEHIVDSFRELLFLEGDMPIKHYDYHTLLRYVYLTGLSCKCASDRAH